MLMETFWLAQTIGMIGSLIFLIGVQLKDKKIL